MFEQIKVVGIFLLLPSLQTQAHYIQRGLFKGGR